jgi:hypothetical protein
MATEPVASALGEGDAGVPAAEPTLPPPGTPRPSPEELQRIFAANGQAILGPALGPDD